MATNKTRDKRKISRYLSIGQPFELNLSDVEDEDRQDALGNNIGAAKPQSGQDTSRNDSRNVGLAGVEPLSGANFEPQRINTLQPPSPGVTNDKLSNTGLRNVFMPQAPPLLSGNVTGESLMRNLGASLYDDAPIATGNDILAPLSGRFPAPIDIRGEAAKVAAEPAPRQSMEDTPEGRLLATLANTNPTPRSFLKRLFVSLAEGASRIQPGDTMGTALGRIAGSGAAGVIPAVDSAKVYQNSRERAIERFKLEAGQREQQRAQQKLDADIKESQARLEETRAARQERREVQRQIEQARLRDDARADAQQLLKILEETPEEEKEERLRVTQQLRNKHGIRVSPNYGVTKQKDAKKQADITIFDEDSNQYIRANADGTPKLDAKGNKIVMRPGKAAKQETQAEKRKRIAGELNNEEGTVDAIAPGFVDTNAILMDMPQKWVDALRNPREASTLTYKDAREAFDKAYETALKKAKAETNSRREAAIAARMADDDDAIPVDNREESSRQSRTTPPKARKAGVQATPRNSRQGRDFRQPWAAAGKRALP